MARSKKKRDEREDEDDDVEEGDDEDDDGAVARDYVLARTAVATTSLHAAKGALDEMVALFMTPDDDSSGRKRKELLDDALEAASCAVRAIEAANDEIDECDMKAEEPWEGDPE